MTLRVAFVPGATPDKWARAWRERTREPLELFLVEESEQRVVLEDGRADMVLARLPLGGPEDDLFCVRALRGAPGRRGQPRAPGLGAGGAAGRGPLRRAVRARGSRRDRAGRAAAAVRPDVGQGRRRGGGERQRGGGPADVGRPAAPPQGRDGTSWSPTWRRPGSAWSGGASATTPAPRPSSGWSRAAPHAARAAERPARPRRGSMGDHGDMTGQPRWFTDTKDGHSQWYVDRFRTLAAEGADLEGEARLVDAMRPRGARILDAGCGPGRLAGRAARARATGSGASTSTRCWSRRPRSTTPGRPTGWPTCRPSSSTPTRSTWWSPRAT